MHHFENAEKELSAHEMAVKETAIFFYQMATLTKKREFAGWINAWNPRFDWAGETLQKKLLKDLLVQVNQALDRDEKALGIAKKFRLLSQQCDELAQRYESLSKQKVLKREKRPQLDENIGLHQAITCFLSRSGCQLTGALDTGFYTRNAVDALLIYSRSRDTLENRLDNQHFEGFLASMDEHYLLEGYPHDLLAFDAHAIRQGEAVKSIILKPDYCSTFLVKEGDSVNPYEGGRTVSMSSGKRSLKQSA